MPTIDLTWDTFLNSDPKQGDMSQATLTSAWVAVRGRAWDIQLNWPATGTPIGTLSFEASNDKVNADPITNDVLPAVVPPAGTAGTTSLHNPGVLRSEFVRAKYARTSGGTAAALTGKAVKGAS